MQTSNCSICLSDVDSQEIIDLSGEARDLCCSECCRELAVRHLQSSKFTAQPLRGPSGTCIPESKWREFANRTVRSFPMKDTYQSPALQEWKTHTLSIHSQVQIRCPECDATESLMPHFGQPDIRGEDSASESSSETDVDVLESAGGVEMAALDRAAAARVVAFRELQTCPVAFGVRGEAAVRLVDSKLSQYLAYAIGADELLAHLLTMLRWPTSSNDKAQFRYASMTHASDGSGAVVVVHSHPLPDSTSSSAAAADPAWPSEPAAKADGSATTTTPGSNTDSASLRALYELQQGRLDEVQRVLHHLSCSIEDTERRARLMLAWLRRCRFVYTSCCFSEVRAFAVIERFKECCFWRGGDGVAC